MAKTSSTGISKTKLQESFNCLWLLLCQKNNLPNSQAYYVVFNMKER